MDYSVDLRIVSETDRKRQMRTNNQRKWREKKHREKMAHYANGSIGQEEEDDA